MYVVNIDEKSARGKAFKTLLAQESAAKLISMDDYDAAESEALMAAMKEDQDSPLLSVEEGKAEFKRLRKRHSK